MTQQDFLKLKETLGSTTLVAVSKTKPIEAVEKVYNYGQRIFGENRVNEVIEKAQTLPKDIEWHFIGHLQSKKVKSLVPHVHMIHSIDSEKLLLEVNKQAGKLDKTIKVLLQFHIAQESSKYGLSIEEAQDILMRHQLSELKYVQIVGVMGMATFTEDEQTVRAEFSTLKNIFETLKQDNFSGNPEFKEISMGMSGDYPIAIECGSTMVRIGSLLFGARH